MEVILQQIATEQILPLAWGNHADIIALTAGHRGILDFTVIGTTTENVMRQAGSAAWVLPFGQGTV